MRDHRLYLNDILSAIRQIEKFVEDMSFDAFCDDDKTLSAVIRKFEVIGEAAKGIPEEIRHKNQNIPWREMAGMRDRLIHAYFAVDAELIWHTIQKRLPEVKQLITQILEDN